MHKILLLLTSTISLTSSLVFAVINPTPHPYTLLPEYKCDEKNYMKVPNMPRVRSQDSTTGCIGFTAWALLQHRYCQTNNIKDCSKLTPENEISPFSTMSFSYTNIYDDKKKLDITNFRSLHIHPNFPNREYYANVTSTLQYINTYAKYNLAPESCYPFDQIANSLGLNSPLVNEVFSAMYTVFKDLKTNTEGDVICDDCNNRFKKISGIEKLKLKLEFSETLTGIKNFEQFLYQTVIGTKCDENTHLKKPLFRVKSFPAKSKAEDTSLKDDIPKEEFMKVISQQIEKGNPVAISGICVFRDKNSDCLESHATTIAGTKTSCTCSEPKNCRTMYLLHNSLGKGWQDNTNNGGWVDAEILISNLYSRKEYGTLTWIED